LQQTRTVFWRKKSRPLIFYFLLLSLTKVFFVFFFPFWREYNSDQSFWLFINKFEFSIFTFCRRRKFSRGRFFLVVINFLFEQLVNVGNHILYIKCEWCMQNYQTKEKSNQIHQRVVIFNCHHILLSVNIFSNENIFCAISFFNFRSKLFHIKNSNL